MTGSGAKCGPSLCAVPWESSESWALALLPWDARQDQQGICPHLSDPVVIGQEHGQVLRFLDGLGVRHLPQELGRSETQRRG